MPADSRDFSKDGVVRGRVAFAALLACVPLLLGAHRGTWRKTAESHLRFARELAAEGKVFDLATREAFFGADTRLSV